MKTLLLSLSLAVAAVGMAGTAHAQVYQPNATRGAVLGAVAGGLIGGHNNDRWAEGAVIGGIAGAIIGAATTPPTPQRVYERTPDVVYAPPPAPVIVQPAPVIETAPVVPAAPQVVYAPAPVVQAPPQVVYVEQAPRVVYVQPAPRVVYAPPPPVVSFGVRYYSGPGPRYDDHRGHGPDRHDYGHRR